WIENDYLDHNLNRVEPNGNIIRMGVEMDPVWRFPVAYWFLNRRPNDEFYTYQQHFQKDIYQRIEARFIRHIFIRYYPEQTRGWPWLFAAVLSLHMMGKYHEAALVNALIGASKQGFYKKTLPTGFEPEIDPLTGKMFKDDTGALIDQVEPGSWVELPYGVEIQQWNPTYPHEQYGPFNEAALYAVSAAAKMSYMTLTGDVSKANFSSLRHGVNGEREQWMTLQEFWIRKWKKPGFDEELFRGILSGQIKLPIGKFDKFNRPEFTGRRWGFVTPVQDWQAKMMQVDMCAGSISAIIKEQGADPWETFKEISQEQEWMKELGIARVHSTYQLVNLETDTAAPAAPPKPEPAGATE
ncbi:MAG TPA: phage portal protein, partial [Candidatus Binatia bacterium]